MSGTTAFTRQFSSAAARFLLVCGALLAAWLVLAAQARAAEQLLPNLVADPATNISLETSTTEGGLKKKLPRSCCCVSTAMSTISVRARSTSAARANRRAKR